MSEPLSNAVTRDVMHTWLSSRLGCLPGRREFNLGRFEHCIVDSDKQLQAHYESLLARLNSFSSSGCLFVFPSIPASNEVSVDHVFSELARKVRILAGIAGEESDGDSKIGVSLPLRCAVTNQVVTYHDFEFVAFCPQANNEQDRLYNPSLEAPFPSVNFTSDLFGFALLVRDTSLKQYGCAPYEIEDAQARDDLFESSAKTWQGLAVKTMREFASRTNPQRRCPIHVNKSQTHWISAHSDSAFASLDPHLYVQELPKSYAPRVINKWRQWFLRREAIDFTDVSAGEVSYRPACDSMASVGGV